MENRWIYRHSRLRGNDGVILAGVFLPPKRFAQYAKQFAIGV
jgi:hypothetical protein